MAMLVITRWSFNNHICFDGVAFHRWSHRIPAAIVVDPRNTHSPGTAGGTVWQAPRQGATMDLCHVWSMRLVKKRSWMRSYIQFLHTGWFINWMFYNVYVWEGLSIDLKWSCYLPVHPSIHLSYNLSTYPSIHPTINLSTYLYVSMYQSLCCSLTWVRETLTKFLCFIWINSISFSSCSAIFSPSLGYPWAMRA